jgi:L-lactate dehydrogenase complex protein LldE
MITCLADALFPEVGMSTVHVLENLGCTVDFPEGQTCCGQAAFNSGQRDAALRSARAFIKAFEKSEFVVSVSGSCAAMIRHHYPSLFHGLPEEECAELLATRTYEFSEFVVNVLRVHHLPVSYQARSTFHHSCHTRRLLGVKSEPEILLSLIEGLEHLPLGHSEDCCGFGGTFALKMGAISQAMVDEKVDHILETGADLLIGLDMACLMNIDGRLRRRGYELKVKHLAEVLAEGWKP